MALSGSGCDCAGFRHLGQCGHGTFAPILAREAIPTRTMKYDLKGVQFLYARRRATG